MRATKLSTKWFQQLVVVVYVEIQRARGNVNLLKHLKKLVPKKTSEDLAANIIASCSAVPEKTNEPLKSLLHLTLKNGNVDKPA